MGGSTSGKGATTSSSAPPGQAMQSYEGLMHRANQLSNQPYNPYTGQLVANLTPQQQQAFSEYGNAYGAAQPYIDQAAAYGSLGASPIQASQIQNYLNPYQQDVIGATESQMNNIDAAQLAQTQGQGMGAGGLFNDRLGVAQGQVANQQALANNQTLAGLNVQNYSQALAAAQADRAAAAQGAYTFGNLGQENLQSILAGAGANLQAGNAQQQQQQNVLNSTYGQWQQAQAYPYQQIGWAAGIDTGLGSNMGGQSSTQPGAPNPISQYGGLALTAAGMGYNMNQGTPAFAKRGGAIRGFDAGGATPYGAGASWIPNVQITHGSGPPKPPGAPQQQAGQMPKMPGGVGKGSAGAGTAASGTSIAGEAGDALGSFGDMVGGATAAGDVGDFAALALLANKGGRVDVGRPRGLEWGHGIRGYADGGAPYNAVPAALPGLMDEPEDPDAPRGLGSVPFGPPDPEAFSPGYMGVPPPAHNRLEGGYSLGDVGPGTGFDFNPVRTSGNRADTDPDLTDPDGLHAPLEDGPGAPGKPAGETLLARGAEPPPDNGTAPDGLHRPFEPLPGRQDRAEAEAGLGDIPRVAPPQQSRSNGIGNALMAAGLSLMANRSPYLGPALGEAGLAGLSSYTGEQHHQEQQEHLATKEKLDQEKADRQLKMLEDQSKRADRTAAETHRHNTATEGQNTATHALAAMKPMVIDRDSYDRPIMGRMDAKGNITTMDGQPYTPKQKAKAEAEANLTGDDYVNTLPENHRAQVRQAGAYMAQVPGANTRSPLARQLRDEIYQAYPDIDERMYGAENSAVRKFWSGPDADTLKSQNVAIMHLGTLQQAANALKNGDYQKVNSLLNWWSKETGKPAPTDFNAVRDIAQDEVIKAVVGARAGVTEREEAHKRVSSDFSQGQLDGVINHYKDLMAGQVIGLRQKFTSTTGMQPQVFDRFLLPETKAQLQAHEAASASPSSGAAAQAIPPPAQRQVGKAYTNQRGQSATWTGTGWQASP